MQFTFTQPFLYITGHPNRPFVLVTIRRGERLLAQFPAQPGVCPEARDSITFKLDMTDFRGETADLSLSPLQSPLIPAHIPPVTEEETDALYAFFTCGPAPIPGEGYTDNPHRPLVHFTPRQGWMNDPNGCILHDGVYHLSFQHAPAALVPLYQNMWGHVTSRDLLHWQEQPPVVRRRANSGGAWIHGKTGQLCICHDNSVEISDDGGYHYTVLSEQPWGTWGDPKILYEEAFGHFVCVAQVPEQGNPHFNTVAIYVSDDLKNWTKTDTHTGYHECPDLYSVPLADGSGRKWVMCSGDGGYRLGEFDGYRFTPDTEEPGCPDPFQPLKPGIFGEHKHNSCYPDAGISPEFPRMVSYAFQCFTAPQEESRTVRVAWMLVGYRQLGEEFDQCLSFPHTLVARRNAFGRLRLFAQPVEEIRLAYDGEYSTQSTLTVIGKAFDCLAETALDGAAAVGCFGFSLDRERDALLVRVSDRHTFTAPYRPLGDTLRVRAIVDVGTVEFFIGEGELYIPLRYNNYDDTELTVAVTGGAATVHPLKRTVGIAEL